MSFAGIAYKLGEQDAATLAAKLRPLEGGFETALGRVRALAVPASMSALQERYLGALERCGRDASRDP